MLDLVTDALATFRIVRLVNVDRIAQPLRDAAEKRGPTAAYFIECPWCVGLWAAFGVVAASRVAPRAWRPVAQALAFSAVTGLLAEHT